MAGVLDQHRPLAVEVERDGLDGGVLLPRPPTRRCGVSYAFGERDEERDGDSNGKAPPSSSMAGDLLAGGTEGGGRGFPWGCVRDGECGSTDEDHWVHTRSGWMRRGRCSGAVGRNRGGHPARTIC